jgi:osmotically-inducible protein OsmY
MSDTISEAARGRLRESAYFALRTIDCLHQDGVLTLRGCLPSYYLKQVAQASVTDIAGVRAVANQIEVTAPMPRGAVAL